MIGLNFLGITTINDMMKYDRQGEITYKLIQNGYILCFENIDKIFLYRPYVRI